MTHSIVRQNEVTLGVGLIQESDNQYVQNSHCYFTDWDQCWSMQPAFLSIFALLRYQLNRLNEIFARSRIKFYCLFLAHHLLIHLLTSFSLLISPYLYLFICLFLCLNLYPSLHYLCTLSLSLALSPSFQWWTPSWNEDVCLCRNCDCGD